MIVCIELRSLQHYYFMVVGYAPTQFSMNISSYTDRHCLAQHTHFIFYTTNKNTQHPPPSHGAALALAVSLFFPPSRMIVNLRTIHQSPFSKLSNLRTSRSKSHKPFFRNLVTFCTFLAVISLTPSSSFLLLLSLTNVFAVMAKRMSLGPSTSSRIALGAWSWCLLIGSMRRTRV